MRAWLKAHAHSAAAFAAMLLIAVVLGSAQGTPERSPVIGLPAAAIELPGPDQDQDRDTYADGIDRIDGDGHVRLRIDGLDADVKEPYFVVGTQDDQWRFGAGRELEWHHIVDPDPLGHKTASSAWQAHAIRTGAWWYATPMDGASRAMADGGVIDQDAPGIEWPQVFHVNIRDDADQVSIQIELMDQAGRPDRLVHTWDVIVDVTTGTWSIAGATGNASQVLDVSESGAGLRLAVEVTPGISWADQQAIAQRWAPHIRFDSQERFYPIAGDVMDTFHGFTRRSHDEADLRTWTGSFDNGRDSYVLHLSDFNGDRDLDHQDVAVMTDWLRAGNPKDTVYAHVFPTTGDRVVVQYWFLYMYNFVENVAGDDVPRLAHKGDREFIQLTFNSVEDAATGVPASIAYSQHYRGIRIEQPFMDDAPFINGTPEVYPARGSHASYPMPGDDRRFRNALASYGDEFDGEGESWAPGNYTLELFDSQRWAFGHLWAPHTRHSRDLGTSAQPLLIYDFRYPYIDPLSWERDLPELHQDALAAAYGGGS